MEVLILYTFIILFVILEGYFAGIETAYVSANKLKLKSFKDNKDKRLKKILKLLKEPDKTLSALLVGTNLSVVAATSFASVLFIRKYGKAGEYYATLTMSLIILIFGEILPKSIYRKLSNNILLDTANILYFFTRLFTPIINLILFLVKFTPVLSTLQKKKKKISFSREDLKILFKVSAREGVIKEEDKDLFYSLFDFSDTYVREIMVPLINITLIEKNKKVIDVIDLSRKCGHSRIPVYDNYVYNIIGYIYVIDLLKARATEDIEKYIRTPYYVPETKMIDELFIEMNDNRLPMVFVVDEYGGVSGMVTLEDIVEEILGDISESPDEPVDIKIIQKSKYVWEVEGDTDIDDLKEEIGISLTKEGFETIAGFVEYKLGKIPVKNETVRVDNYKITVLDSTPRKIHKLKIEKLVRRKK